VAHRRGVVHRDLKPANILLDEDGNAYLADFGIAKDLGKQVSPYQTDQTSVVGSPAYLAPEQVKAEAITPQTDIYSLGVMLYEILTGQLPFQAPTPIALMFKHINEPMPALGQMRPDLPAAVNVVIQRATAKQPAARYADVATMLAELRQALGLAAGSAMAAVDGGAYATPAPGTVTGTGSGRRTTYETGLIELRPLAPPSDPGLYANPYKGLRAFQEADAADFFGREALVETLLERLREPGPFARFLAVVGPSGSGKSSVVRAGLVPALKRGALPGSANWFVLELFPSADPLGALAQALLRIAVNPPNDLVGPLGLDAQGLVRVVDQVVPGGDETEVVLVIDQFEELFTLVADEAVRAHVLQLLITAVTDPYSRVRVLVTLRADFYDRPLGYSGFSALMRKRTEVVVPLSGEELRAAIVRPAERAGLRVDPELVEAIVSDVGEQPGALPLLQYALTEVVERRQGRVLTLTPYEASGGVVGALGRRAEELYSGLDGAAQEVTRQLFLRLVTLGEGVEDTRRRVRRTEVQAAGGGAGVLDGVIGAYAEYRLLTLDHDPQTRTPTVEVAHEALIRTWGRLRGWLAASREDVRVQRRLSAAAGEWAGSGGEGSFLASGARLEQLVGWARETHLGLNAEEQAYLAASVAARDAQQAAEAARAAREARLEARTKQVLRALVGVFAVAAVVAVGLSLYAFQQRGQARANEQRAQTNANVASTAEANAKTAAEAAGAQKIIAEQNAADARRSAAEARNLALAAGAQAALNKGDTGQALALALAANRGDAPVIQSEVVLSEAAYARGTRRVYRGHKAGVQAVALSRDGKTMLSGSDDKTLILWDVASGAQIRSFTGHTGKLLSVSLSPDGRLAVSSADDKTVIVWDVATGQALRNLTGHLDVVNEVAFGPDSKVVLTGSKDKTIMLWDATTGQALRTFTGHTQPVQSVMFNRDGTRLLSGSLDTSVRLWDVTSGAQIRVFEGHTRSVWDATFSPDEKTALSSSEDRTIILWDLESGQQIRQFRGHTNDVWKVKYSPDGKTAISTSRDTRIGLWNIATGDLLLFLYGHGGSVRDASFTADGRNIASASIDTTLRLWDLTTGGEIGRFTGHTDGVNRVVISPDGKLVLSAASDGQLLLWDIATGTIKYTLAGHSGGVFGAAFSPDGKAAISGSEDQTMILWDVTTGKLLKVFPGHTGGVSSVAFSPDGKTAISGGVDKVIIQWDLVTGQIIRRFEGHKDQVFNLAYSPDGKTFLSASGDATVIDWDVATGKQLSVFKGHTAVVRYAVFSADGTHALSSGDDRLVLLWDVATGTITRRFVGHTAAVRAAAFSPKSDWVLSGSTDTDVILWDVTTGNALRRFSGHTGIVRAVAFGADGKTAISGSNDGTVRIWRIDSLPELIDWTRANRSVPELTCDQERYYQLDPAHCDAAAASSG
jgi:WD40 repeat protein